MIREYPILLRPFSIANIGALRYERSPLLGVTRSGGAALGKSVSPPAKGRSWSPPGARDDEISLGFLCGNKIGVREIIHDPTELLIS